MRNKTKKNKNKAYNKPKNKHKTMNKNRYKREVKMIPLYRPVSVNNRKTPRLGHFTINPETRAIRLQYCRRI